jgi:hypothetical protein
VADTAQVLKYLQNSISVKREDVARAKQYVMKQTMSSTLGMSEHWLGEHNAVPPNVINIRAEDLPVALESLARSISLRMALFQAVWELIASGDIVATEKCEHWKPRHGYTTEHSRFSSSERGELSLDQITFPYISHIFRLPGTGRVPADTDIFLQGINCATLHPGIKQAIGQALVCFQRGLYMPATAMLAAAAEATWTECGKAVAAKLPNPKLDAVVNDAYASISKKVTETRKALEAADGKALLKLADRTGADVVNAEVWTTALRERRNALHWDKSKSFVIGHSEAADLLISAPQHLATLEAIRAVR